MHSNKRWSQNEDCRTESSLCNRNHCAPKLSALACCFVLCLHSRCLEFSRCERAEHSGGKDLMTRLIAIAFGCAMSSRSEEITWKQKITLSRQVYLRQKKSDAPQGTIVVTLGDIVKFALFFIICFLISIAATERLVSFGPA